jgi:hypothetical protein
MDGYHRRATAPERGDEVWAVEQVQGAAGQFQGKEELLPTMVAGSQKPLGTEVRAQVQGAPLLSGLEYHVLVFAIQASDGFYQAGDVATQASGAIVGHAGIDADAHGLRIGQRPEGVKEGPKARRN